MKSRTRMALGLLAALAMLVTMLAPAAVADDGELHPSAGDLSAPLAERDAAAADHGVVSSGPFADVTKNIDARGIGARDVDNATTDVWSHEGYAYTGTFNSPCGGEEGGGVWVWDVSNPNKVGFVTIIDSPAGSRSNDVRVAAMNSGDVLVHSNESCAGGPGGFEIFNVDDPTNPVYLASVQTDDINILIRDNFGFTDFGVHNLWLFSHGSNDYVAATVEGLFGNFQIFDITDPTAPALVGWWGAEEIGFPGVDWVNEADLGLIIAGQTYNWFSGFGASANRRLHDVTINADGSRAYLANWDAGLVLLDITNPADPQLVSVALDPVNGSLDGEVNSHSVWMNEDGSIVVEGEEDFSVFESQQPFLGTLQGLNTIHGFGASTTTGDAFEASQTGNNGTLTVDMLTVDTGPLAGSSFEVLEMVGNNAPIGGGSVSGDLVWIGRACNGDDFENAISAGDIAIARRGVCFFSEKEANAAAAGAAAIVIANNQQDSVWSGLRIWDYSDETNPVLKSTFDTVCSANPSDPSCNPLGTYSVHNVVVETTGNKVKAYVSWYSDGMLILDVTDTENPVEIGRYTEQGTDFWGVYKEPNSPFFYGSDRNGGLYVFKEQGSGSGKN